MHAQLIPVDGSPPIAITRDLTLVGRKEDCDLCLSHKSVSKLHCVIVKTDGLLILRDLGSTNGTRVNGQRVRRAALLPNDQLAIATFKFRVHMGPEPVSQEQTLRLEPQEAAAARLPAPAEEESEAAEPIPSPPLKSNPLPDVYPEEPASGPAPR
jgi:pSer/pThr/pTyr-binding forkhead associated (FHA) protein